MMAMLAGVLSVFVGAAALALAYGGLPMLFCIGLVGLNRSGHRDRQ